MTLCGDCTVLSARFSPSCLLGQYSVGEYSLRLLICISVTPTSSLPVYSRATVLTDSIGKTYFQFLTRLLNAQSVEG